MTTKRREVRRRWPRVYPFTIDALNSTRESNLEVEVIAHILLPLIVAVSIALMLARPRGIAEVWWISGGVLLLIIVRLVPLELAGQAVAKGTDVYLFLAGMMLLSELARE